MGKTDNIQSAVLKAIIVDDEPKAIRLLENYLQHFPEIELSGSFRNGIKAISFVNTQPVDLVFLDINMPHISGMSIAKLLNRNPQIIFTTAYSEYAVESYELDAVDYLLKPITLERFTRTVQKILREKQGENSAMEPDANRRILVKSGAKTYQLEPAQIYYLEKDHNYMLYHLTEEKIMARQSAAEALKILPDSFLQIHKSFIVNRDHIQFFDRHEISVKGRKLSLGASFRDSFLEKMQ